MKFRVWPSSKKYFIPLYILIIIVAVFKAIHDQQSRTNQFKQWWLNESFRGSIHDKYIDEENHMNEALIISHDSDTVLTGWKTDDSGLFDYCQIGDSIIKVENSLEVYIIKVDGSRRKFNTYSHLED
ncbi:hypothetical protein GF312_11855 [Candidatus Poribacteria bacterium]|nr:hypothetical protein [Candidatus Poribacteria bacterium]